MIFQRKLLATLLVGTSLGLNAASAGAVTSTFTFPNPTVVGGNGSLNVGSYLPSGNVASFSSGTLDFSFSAPAGAPSLTGTNVTPATPTHTNSYIGYITYYCCGFGGFSTCSYNNWYFDNYYTNSSTNIYSTPAQSATVAVGGNTATAAAPSTITNVPNGSSSSKYWRRGGGGYNIDTTYLYDNTTTIGGSFNATLALDPTALGVLNNTGLIGFGLQTVGNVTLNRVAFTGNYTLAPVPEPETYAMLLAGLGLLGFTARRRKQSA